MDPPSRSAPTGIVFYDGICVLCQFVVKRLMELDTDGKLHFAPLQGQTAQACGIIFDPATPPSAQTFKFIDSRGPAPIVYDRMAAARATLQYINRYPPVVWLLGIVPTPLSNLAYRVVAGTRYRLFGTYDECPMPPAEVRARFLP